LASKRKAPFSMSPEFTPSANSRARRVVAYARTSSTVRRSGALTISSKGTPARLKSTNAPPSLWISLPVSSSKCTRLM